MERKMKTDLVDEIVCVKYRLMPDSLLLQYAAKVLTSAERNAVQQELALRRLTR